jgi:hypothetical protein
MYSKWATDSEDDSDDDCDYSGVHMQSAHSTVLPAVGGRANKHQRDSTPKPKPADTPIELRIVDASSDDDSDDDDATSQHTQSHQHSKSAATKVVAPPFATCHTDQNALDTQRTELQSAGNFQIHRGRRYRLASTLQADGVHLHVDKKVENPVKDMETAYASGVDGLHTPDVKPHNCNATLLLQRTSTAQENTFAVATSSKDEPTNFDTTTNLSKSVVTKVRLDKFVSKSVVKNLSKTF